MCVRFSFFFSRRTGKFGIWQIRGQRNLFFPRRHGRILRYRLHISRYRSRFRFRHGWLAGWRCLRLAWLWPRRGATLAGRCSSARRFQRGSCRTHGTSIWAGYRRTRANRRRSAAQARCRRCCRSLRRGGPRCRSRLRCRRRTNLRPRPTDWRRCYRAAIGLRPECQHAQQGHRETGIFVWRQSQFITAMYGDLVKQLYFLGIEQGRQPDHFFAFRQIVGQGCGHALRQGYPMQ